MSGVVWCHITECPDLTLTRRLYPWQVRLGVSLYSVLLCLYGVTLVTCRYSVLPPYSGSAFVHFLYSCASYSVLLCYYYASSCATWYPQMLANNNNMSSPGLGSGIREMIIILQQIIAHATNVGRLADFPRVNQNHPPVRTIHIPRTTWMASLSLE